MKKLLVVGWDAADWKVISPLIDAGAMPNLARLVEQGVVGDLRTLQPPLSPLLWTSIATGKRADQHGILDFREVNAESGRVQAATSTSRRTKAFWNMLNDHGLRTHVIGWLGSHPAESIDGICVTDSFIHATAAPGDPWPLLPGTIYPAKHAEALGELRVAPDELEEDLILPFIPRAGEIDQEHDRRLAYFAKALSEAMSIQAAATWAMDNEEWDMTAAFFIAPDHFSHTFMPYHPPQMAGVPDSDFAIYSPVIENIYRFHDMMLGELVRRAGPDAHVLVLSDHGFHSDHLRPRYTPHLPSGPTIWHRTHGIFCLAGPGIRRDERLYGASLLDIAPTILTLFGLPAGEDFEGRVLVEAFETPPAITRIPSWDSVGAPVTRPSATLSNEESTALLEQFIALGYIERPDQNLDAAARACRLEQDWNLARVLLEKQDWSRAFPLLGSVRHRAPDRMDIAILTLQCQVHLGLYADAEATLDSLRQNLGETPVIRTFAGVLALHRGNVAEGLETLRSAMEPAGVPVLIPVQAGHALLRHGYFAEAEAAFARGRSIDAYDPMPWTGLAMVAQKRRQHDVACDAALRAIGLQFQLPRAHYLLGMSLAALGLYERAAQAFATSLSFRSPMPRAHRWQAWLHGRHLHQPEAASEHQRLWRQSLAKAAAVPQTLEALRGNEATPLPPPASPAISSAAEPLLIVSGLPRSGTSLMMQILQAGGISPMTDRLRQPDEDNPRGYLEWQAIQTVGQHPEILEEARGRVVKIVTALIPALPKDQSFRVIFMDRPIEEVVRSQRQMLAHRSMPQPSLEGLTDQLHRHRAAVLCEIEGDPRFELLVVDYPRLVRDPDREIARVQAFVGPHRLPDADAMRNAILPGLYRNRAPQSPDAHAG